MLGGLYIAGQKLMTSIHSESFIEYFLRGPQVGWSLPQLTLTEGWGTPWTGPRSITGLTQKNKYPFSLTANLESPKKKVYSVGIG